MKSILITLLILFSGGLCFGQAKDADGYFPLFEDSKTAKYFKMGNASYLDYFSAKRVSFENNEYHIRIRLYSWGDKDTTYYREDPENYYSFDPKTGKESVVLPKMVSVGQKWYEGDESWSYKITKVNKKLRTPYKKYTDLIEVKCEQLKNRDVEKSSVYYIYYAKDVGYVASKSSSGSFSYLHELKTDAKEGDILGKI